MQQISPPTPGTDSSTTSTTSTTAANPNTDIATITDEVAVIEEVQETTEITSGGSDNNNQTAGGSGGGGGMKISFSVTKQKTTKVVAKNKLVGRREQDEDDEEEDGSGRKRGILRLEDGIIVDSEAPQKKKAKVFVIPVLRLSSQSQIERLKKLVEDGTATEQDKARLALLLESMEEQGGEAGGQQQFGAGNDKIYLASSGAPTVVVPDDVDPDYDSMPVGEFGLAFLRGCGWKDERSVIGKTNAQAVPLRVTAPRPKGLGLGATLPSAPPDIKKKVESAVSGGGEEDELKPLGKKSFVKCLGGLNNGSYGQVTSMDEENSSVFVELTWPPERAGKTVRISQWIVEVVSATEHRAKTGGGGAHENGRHNNNTKSREQRIRV